MLWLAKRRRKATKSKLIAVRIEATRGEHAFIVERLLSDTNAF
jgi:hypothetical protein